jgi:hypothetical protein
VRKYCALVIGTAATGTCRDRVVSVAGGLTRGTGDTECLAAVAETGGIAALVAALADASDEVVLAAVMALDDACLQRASVCAVCVSPQRWV